MGSELARLESFGWHAPDPAHDAVRYVASSGGASVSYPEDGLTVLGDDGGSGYWFDHRAAAVRRRLAERRVDVLWEVGAGTGSMAHGLRPGLNEVVTVEPLPAGARASAMLGLTSICARLEDLGLPTGSLAAVGMFDVIEHLERPEDLLAEVRRVLRPGGTLLVTVPALNVLWGDEDDVAGHFRRYTLTKLRTEVEAAGFSAESVEYLYASLVPPAALLRALPYRLGRRVPPERVLAAMHRQLRPHRVVDRLARGLLSVETAIGRVVPLPFGLSALGVFIADDAGASE